MNKFQTGPSLNSLSNQAIVAGMHETDIIIVEALVTRILLCDEFWKEFSAEDGLVDRRALWEAIQGEGATQN